MTKFCRMKLSLIQQNTAAKCDALSDMASSTLKNQHGGNTAGTTHHSPAVFEWSVPQTCCKRISSALRIQHSGNDAGMTHLFPARVESPTPGGDCNVQQAVYRGHMIILVKGRGLESLLGIPFGHHLRTAPGCSLQNMDWVGELGQGLIQGLGQGLSQGLGQGCMR